MARAPFLVSAKPLSLLRQHLGSTCSQPAHLGFVHVDHHRFDDRLALRGYCPPALIAPASVARQALKSLPLSD